MVLSADWDETLRRTGGTRPLGALVNGARLDQNQTPNQFGMFLRCVDVVDCIRYRRASRSVLRFRTPERCHDDRLTSLLTDQYKAVSSECSNVTNSE